MTTSASTCGTLALVGIIGLCSALTLPGCGRSATTSAEKPLSADERQQIPGVIAFVSERGADKDIWLIRPTGHERQLTGQTPGRPPTDEAGSGSARRSESEDDFPAVFRPGGQELLAVATREIDGAHREQLRIVSIPGAGAEAAAGPPIPLHPPSGRGRNPSFAGDGSFFVAESSAYGFSDLVRTAPGTRPERLTESKHGCFEPSVTPDGKQLAFVSSRDGNPEIYVMDLGILGSEPENRREARRLTDSDREDGRPSFSPDGTWLAFMSRRDQERVRVFLMRPDGSELHPLSGFGDTGDTGDERELAWSPDGQSIAFVGRQKNGETRIYRTAIGSAQKPGPTTALTEGRHRDDQPAWSPDSKYLAYVSDRTGETDLYLMRADGTGKTRLTTAKGADWLPRWSPPGGPAPAPWPPLGKPNGDPSGDPSGDPDAAVTTARAHDYQRRAKALEPSVTPMLQKLAKAVGGELIGLEHRFKSESSLRRKITERLRSLRAADKGASITAADVIINDALRYTIGVDDKPLGHYTKSVHATLAKLEAAGHVVRQVKNYWPRGDNYSGVNSVLEATSGLLWEVQFHTSASTSTQKQYHGHYRELRARDTERARKQALFDEMSAPWETVPIPERALVEHSLHEREEIVELPRP